MATGLDTILLINYWVGGSKQLQSIFASIINARLEDQQAAATLGVRDVLGWDSPDLDDFGKKMMTGGHRLGFKKKEKLIIIT